MKEEIKKNQDIHGTEATTHWVHKHRRLAMWALKLLTAGITSLLYYLRRQEKEIEHEQKKMK